MDERARAAGGSSGHSGGDHGGSTQASPGTVPAGQRCVWPGCTRRRAAGRTAGSGRQKEYCLQADPPEAGGGPVHNARNRWAALRSAANRTALDATGSADGYGELGDGSGGVGPTDASGPAGRTGPPGKRVRLGERVPPGRRAPRAGRVAAWTALATRGRSWGAGSKPGSFQIN